MQPLTLLLRPPLHHVPGASSCTKRRLALHNQGGAGLYTAEACSCSRFLTLHLEDQAASPLCTSLIYIIGTKQGQGVVNRSKHAAGLETHRCAGPRVALETVCMQGAVGLGCPNVHGITHNVFECQGRKGVHAIRIHVINHFGPPAIASIAGAGPQRTPPHHSSARKPPLPPCPERCWRNQPAPCLHVLQHLPTAASCPSVLSVPYTR